MRSSTLGLVVSIALCASSQGIQKHTFICAMSPSLSDSVKMKSGIGTNSALWIKDSTDYSKSFLNELGASAPANTLLVDSMMILSGSDTVHFPSDPPLRKVLSFSTGFHDADLFLVLARVSQTSIYFRLELSNAFGQRVEQKGIAELSPAIYLGSEVEENRLSHKSYLNTEYAFEQDSCFTVISIGKKDFELEYRVTVIKNCNGAFEYLDLDDFPHRVYQW